METKKYYVRNMKEGLKQIKEELGPEAVILHSRKVRRRGLKGLFLPRMLEIIAVRETPPPVAAAATKTAAPNKEADKRLAAELEELKLLMQQVRRAPAIKRTEPPHQENVFKIKEQQKIINYWERQLFEQDLDPRVISYLLDRTPEEADGDRFITREAFREVLDGKIRRLLRFGQEKEHRFQVFIGPTGVGKTTTLAKLAARFSFYQHERVGLITIDHYRIGAVEQLRTYADITDLPLEVVMTPRDMERALERLQSCERILVDTVGRGSLSLFQINEMASFLQQLQPADIFLVISATTRWQDIRLIADNFSRLKYNRIIVTKLDETRSYGAPVNAVFHTELPLVYITNGQGVPDDITLAKEVNICNLLLGVK